MNLSRPSLELTDAMRTPRAAGRARRAGFTLVEILMAIAISVLILGSASMFMYSSFMLLDRAQNDPGLDHHKLGVTDWIRVAFETAVNDTEIPLNPNSTTNGTSNTTGNTTSNTTTNTTSNTSLGTSLGLGNTSGNLSRAGTVMAPTVNSLSTQTGISSDLSSNTSSNTTGNTTDNSTDSSDMGTTTNTPAPVAKTTLVAWGWPPGFTDAADPMLTFVVPSDNPLLVWDNGPRPPVRAFLYFKENEGLSLLWVPPYTPNQIDVDAVRRTMLSPLVVKMSYMYFNPTTNTWDIEDSPEKDPLTSSYVLPDEVRLVFYMDGKFSNMTIAMPPAESSVPIY